jgi:splicing suppressor protein 51
MEASRDRSSSSPNTLKACPDCKTAFYCSNAHWDAVRHFHAGEPCEDGRNGLSQCQVNQEIRADVAFANFMVGAKAENFKWAPERVKAKWTSLKGINWEEEFGQELAQHFSILASSLGPFIRGASEGLSMPMSILWALENLNEDDSWTRQDTLIIHVSLA